MKFFSTLILFSMLMLTAACSHEPTMSDEFADVQLDNSSSQATAAPTADAVESAPSDLDLTPPSDPTPPARASVGHLAKHHHKKKHSKKKKLAKHKHRSRRDSELARSNY